jgi:hypothetical protein
MTYTKIVGPEPSWWSKTLMDVTTIGSCIGLTVITFIVSNKIEGHWKAKALALAAGTAAVGMRGPEQPDPDIISAARLVEAYGPHLNFGEPIEIADGENRITNGETILKIGPNLYYKNTPNEVLITLHARAPLVSILNPPNALLPAPAPVRHAAAGAKKGGKRGHRR